MNAAARNALHIIRTCIAEDRLVFTIHFLQRLDERALVWPDIAAVFDRPTAMREQDDDTFGRPKWIVSGPAADGLPIDVVCVLDHDNRGRTTMLVTVYFE